MKVHSESVSGTASERCNADYLSGWQSSQRLRDKPLIHENLLSGTLNRQIFAVWAGGKALDAGNSAEHMIEIAVAIHASERHFAASVARSRGNESVMPSLQVEWFSTVRDSFSHRAVSEVPQSSYSTKNLQKSIPEESHGGMV